VQLGRFDRSTAAWLAGGAIILALPAVAGDYALSLMVVGGTYAIICIGLDLFIGRTGQISFGHNAFAAIGCYGTAILTTAYKWPPLAALAVVVVAASATAVVVGAPTIRLRGHYLAMATLALGLIVYQLAVQLESITQGFTGITGIPPLGAFGWELFDDVDYYYAIWIAVGLSAWIYARIVRSRVGRAFAAIADSEEAAGVLGIDVRRYKLLALAISAVYAAVGGSLLAHYVTYVSPEVIGLSMVTLLFFMLFVGGLRTLSGPILGAVLITVLPALLSEFKDYRQLVFGALLLAVIMFVPRGLQSLGELRRFATWGRR
jgi:branched-chain amino acid transport system permease protein